MKKSWHELVEQYSQFEKRFESNVPPPTTNEAIQIMLVAAQNNGLFVPDSYIEFLKLRNGASFNSLMLYGANIPQADPFRRLDLIIMNQYQGNPENETILGTSDMDTYVVVGPKGPYRRLDRASWDTIDEFQTCEELLASIFVAQIEELERLA